MSQGSRVTSTSPEALPIYRTFRLNNASDDPAEISEKEVTEYATDKLDKLVSDSLKKGVYLRITQPVAKGETIGEEDEVEVFYTGRYIDGKVFDTNIEEVARENKIYDSEKSYKAMSVKGNSDSFVKGFMLAITNMKRGEKGPWYSPTIGATASPATIATASTSDRSTHSYST